MRVAVLGTGMVGQALAARLAELGHEVTVGTRDVEATLARSEPDGFGRPGFSAWLSEHPGIGLATFRDAASSADLVVNASSGAVTLEVLGSAGADALAGKVLVDLSNPLDHSAGFPPILSVCNTDSVGEQVQRAFPDARVVKTLNTMNAHLMVQPQSLADGAHSVFVSGDDTAAKQTVTDLLHSFGHTDVIDLGDISTARGPEMFLPLWLRLMGALGSYGFQVKVVR